MYKKLTKTIMHFFFGHIKKQPNVPCDFATLLRTRIPINEHLDKGGWSVQQSSKREGQSLKPEMLPNFVSYSTPGVSVRHSKHLMSVYRTTACRKGTWRTYQEMWSLMLKSIIDKHDARHFFCNENNSGS
jgi:hypothetical protein